MTPRSCFGKMNSILGSVVPLAMFLKKFYLSADEAFDGSYQSNVLVSDEGKNTTQCGFINACFLLRRKLSIFEVFPECLHCHNVALRRYSPLGCLSCVYIPTRRIEQFLLSPKTNNSISGKIAQFFRLSQCRVVHFQATPLGILGPVSIPILPFVNTSKILNEI